MCDVSQKELQQLAEQHEEQVKEMQKLQEQLKASLLEIVVFCYVCM